MFVRLNKDEGKILREDFKEDYKDFELKTIDDSDKYTRPFCTLVLKKKPEALLKQMNAFISKKKKAAAIRISRSSSRLSSSEESKSPTKLKKVKVK